jgi:hypothetical protein
VGGGIEINSYLTVPTTTVPLIFQIAPRISMLCFDEHVSKKEKLILSRKSSNFSNAASCIYSVFIIVYGIIFCLILSCL